MNRLLNIFFGLRLRYVLISFIFLIVILIAAGYFSVRAGRKATLAGLVQQGRALTTVLISSASNIIDSDRQITDIAIDKLIAEVDLIVDNTLDDTEDDTDQSFIETLNAQLGLVRVSIFDRHRSEILKLTTESRSISVILDSLQTYFLSKIKLDEPFDIVFDFYQVQDRRFLFGMLPYKNDKFVFIIYPWTVGQYTNSKLSLAYLLNQLSQEAGIEYIMLQNLDGIVFASKQIYQTDRIEDDPFLVESLEADSALFRVVDFQDREVLEVVQPFNSGEEFYGLFRVGLSLFGYRQLVANFQKQVWLFVVLLVILGLVGSAIVIGYQNLNLMENDLNRTRAISQSLHDSIAGIALSTDENLKIITANISAKKHFGLPDGQPGEWDYNRYFPDDPFRVRAVLRDKRPKSFETQIKGRSGTIDLLVSTSVLINDKGEPTGVIVVAHDVSEKRALENQAQQAHRLSELGTVAAGLAHDIRNPLNAIGMIIQRMESEITVAEGKDEFVDFITTFKSELNKLNTIIEKILQMARSSKLELKEVNIKPIIEQVISIYRYEASEQAIKIESFLDEGKACINEVAFKGIISNLIKNAVEAIGKNGNITVTARFDDKNLVITVEDDGPGIAREQISNLFKPFYTTKPGGTGLGLATAYKSAVDHGGDLKVESQSGGPTRFILTIPQTR